MKVTLLHMSGTFILPATIAMFFFSAANAQIVYTDVNPDKTLNQSVNGSKDYQLDLNNDGTDDYKFTVAFTSGLISGRSVSVKPLGDNEVLDTFLYSSSYYPQNLELNDSISAQRIWKKSTGTLSGTSKTFGEYFWHPSGLWTGTYYLGLRINDATQYYYGWIRVFASATPGSAELIAIDFALNSIAGSPIFAGQTCPPQSLITANGPTTFCLGDSVILSSVNTGTNLSYQWKLNSANIIGATNKSYTAKTAGNYKVKVTDNSNGCSATSAKVKVKVPCKVLNEELNGDENLQASVFPNPFSQTTAISFQLQNDQNVSLKIFDVEGRLIRMLTNESMSSGTHTLTWDAKDENGDVISTGIYLLQLQSSELSQTVKLIVTK